MLTREGFHARFGSSPLFGMVHLLPLPGAPLFGGSLDAIVEAALTDARALQEGGCAAIIFENFGDRPFFKSEVPAVTVAAMTRAILTTVSSVRIAFGVNVLRNDAASALAIAAATGASFIRVNVHTGAMLTDQGVIEGDAANTLRMRASLAPGVLIFADLLVKHALPLVPTDAVQAARDLRVRGLADAIIVSGLETGSPADPDRLLAVRQSVDAPLLVGSGVRESNVAGYASADGIIAGTSLKREGQVDAPVDPKRVIRMVAALTACDAR